MTCYHEIGHFITEYKLSGIVGSISMETFEMLQGFFVKFLSLLAGIVEAHKSRIGCLSACDVGTGVLAEFFRSGNDVEDIVNDLQLYGRRLAYTLALPKGDANDWHNVTVEFFGQKFRTYGDVVQGIENLIPLCWNKKVKVEKYG